MKQSRLFTEVLNDKDAYEDDPRAFKKLRSLVQEWIDKGTLGQPSIGWLNSCFYPPKFTLKPFKFPETPEVDFKYGAGFSSKGGAYGGNYDITIDVNEGVGGRVAGTFNGILIFVNFMTIQTISHFNSKNISNS